MFPFAEVYITPGCKCRGKEFVTGSGLSAGRRACSMRRSEIPEVMLVLCIRPVVRKSVGILSASGGLFMKEEETAEQYERRLAGYVEGKDPVAMQREAASVLARLTGGAAEDKLRRRPAAQKWSVMKFLHIWRKTNWSAVGAIAR